jgi:hypothetical protein
VFSLLCRTWTTDVCVLLMAFNSLASICFDMRYLNMSNLVLYSFKSLYESDTVLLFGFHNVCSLRHATEIWVLLCEHICNYHGQLMWTHVTTTVNLCRHV